VALTDVRKHAHETMYEHAGDAKVQYLRHGVAQKEGSTTIRKKSQVSISTDTWHNDRAAHESPWHPRTKHQKHR